MKDHVDTFLEWAMAFLLGAMVLDVFWECLGPICEL